MRTIAISIDDEAVRALDRLARRAGRRRQRSALIRQALAEFLARQDREACEAVERAAYRRHRAVVNRQARALVADQARP